MLHQNIQALIASRLDETGMSARQASIMAAGHGDLIRDMKRGRIPSFDRVCRLLEVLGVRVEFHGNADGDLYYGTTNTDSAPAISPDRMRDMETGAHALVRVIHESGGDPIPEDLRAVLCVTPRVSEPKPPHVPVRFWAVAEPEDDDDSGAPVGMVELAPVAGDGSVIEDARQMGSLMFQREWLHRRGLYPDQCVVIRVRGESMEPTLRDGCSILVNRASRDRRKGRIFVIYTEDGLVVKRLQKSADGWLLISDHPAWKPTPWPKDAWIEGEVRWMAKTLP